MVSDNNKSQNIAIFIVILLAITSGAVLIWQSFLSAKALDFSYVLDSDSTNTQEYEKEDLNIKFSYPDGYILKERETGNGERFRYSITLLEDTETVRAILNGEMSGTEYPPTINVDIYQNNLDKMTPEEWIRNTSESNYKLSTGKILKINLQGEEGLVYKWSGLYEGVTTVFGDERYIYAFSVNFFEREDKIFSDYESVLSSLSFE